MKLKLQGMFLLSVIGLVSCAHHRDVRPGPGGVHRVVFNVESKDEGAREGLMQAEDYCKEIGKRPVILDENNKYSGSMDEGDYNKGKTIAKVASAVGGAGYVFGGKRESDAGGVVAIGGGIADSVMGKGYTFEMKFKCE